MDDNGCLYECCSVESVVGIRYDLWFMIMIIE